MSCDPWRNITTGMGFKEIGHLGTSEVDTSRAGWRSVTFAYEMYITSEQFEDAVRRLQYLGGRCGLWNLAHSFDRSLIKCRRIFLYWWRPSHLLCPRHSLQRLRKIAPATTWRILWKQSLPMAGNQYSRFCPGLHTEKDALGETLHFCRRSSGEWITRGPKLQVKSCWIFWQDRARRIWYGRKCLHTMVGRHRQ